MRRYVVCVVMCGWVSLVSAMDMAKLLEESKQKRFEAVENKARETARKHTALAKRVDVLENAAKAVPSPVSVLCTVHQLDAATMQSQFDGLQVQINALLSEIRNVRGQLDLAQPLLVPRSGEPLSEGQKIVRDEIVAPLQQLERTMFAALTTHKDEISVTLEQLRAENQKRLHEFAAQQSACCHDLLEPLETRVKSFATAATDAAAEKLRNEIMAQLKEQNDALQAVIDGVDSSHKLAFASMRADVEHRVSALDEEYKREFAPQSALAPLVDRCRELEVGVNSLIGRLARLESSHAAVPAGAAQPGSAAEGNITADDFAEMAHSALEQQTAIAARCTELDANFCALLERVSGLESAYAAVRAREAQPGSVDGGIIADDEKELNEAEKDINTLVTAVRSSLAINGKPVRKDAAYNAWLQRTPEEHDAAQIKIASFFRAYKVRKELSK